MCSTGRDGYPGQSGPDGRQAKGRQNVNLTKNPNVGNISHFGAALSLRETLAGLSSVCRGRAKVADLRLRGGTNAFRI
jgi:hypothetical protein